MQTTNTVTEASDSSILLEIADEISQQITICEKSTRAYKCKFISITDDRPSSTALGWLEILFSILMLLMLF